MQQHRAVGHNGALDQHQSQEQSWAQPGSHRPPHLPGSPAQPTPGGLSGTGTATDPAAHSSEGQGLLLEPDGTMLTLPKSASNVHVVPAGSLVIMPNGTMLRPLSGTYATIYGLITVSPPAADAGGLMQPLPAPQSQQTAQLQIRWWRPPSRRPSHR